MSIAPGSMVGGTVGFATLHETTIVPPPPAATTGSYGPASEPEIFAGADQVELPCGSVAVPIASIWNGTLAAYATKIVPPLSTPIDRSKAAVVSTIGAVH